MKNNLILLILLNCCIEMNAQKEYFKDIFNNTRKVELPFVYDNITKEYLKDSISINYDSLSRFCVRFGQQTFFDRVKYNFKYIPIVSSFAKLDILNYKILFVKLNVELDKNSYEIITLDKDYNFVNCQKLVNKYYKKVKTEYKFVLDSFLFLYDFYDDSTMTHLDRRIFYISGYNIDSSSNLEICGQINQRLHNEPIYNYDTSISYDNFEYKSYYFKNLDLNNSLKSNFKNSFYNHIDFLTLGPQLKKNFKNKKLELVTYFKLEDGRKLFIFKIKGNFYSSLFDKNNKIITKKIINNTLSKEQNIISKIIINENELILKDFQNNSQKFMLKN